MANTYLTRTFGTPTDTKKYTMSVWVKRSSLGVQQSIARSTNGSDDSHVFTFNSDDTLRWDEYGSSSSIGKLVTNRKFRDTNSFYHVVLKWDTANSTAGDRMKMWINGVEETSFSTDTNPSLNATSAFNKASQPINIGRTSYGSGGNYFDGVLSHFHFIDGTAYDASAFGETDATTGEWKGKTSPSVTYGNNGFFILKDGNGITDQSGEGNDFTLGGGTLTDLKDNPDNVFCTMNPLDNYWQGSTFTRGNNTFSTVASKENYNTSTLAMPSNDAGKYYCEVKLDDASAYSLIGLADKLTTSATSNFKNHAYGYAYDSSNGNIINNDSSSSYGNSYTTNDIIGIAVDTDNNKLYFSKNGTWQNSGVPTSGSTGTGAISLSATTTNGYYMFAAGTRHNDDLQVSWNFGNGYFGTTAITTNSGNGYSGAEGSSKFNYTVPTGYSALSTKGLNE